MFADLQNMSKSTIYVTAFNTTKFKYIVLYYYNIVLLNNLFEFQLCSFHN